MRKKTLPWFLSFICCFSLPLSLQGLAKLPNQKISAASEQTLKIWLASQNSGNFEDYKKLYAEDFKGIRRSGDKVAIMSKKEWLKERERMFQKKMIVEASDVTENSNVLTFTQKWKSGSYEDIGTKVLRFRESKDKFLIVFEELKNSMVTPQNVRDCPARTEKDKTLNDGNEQTISQNLQVKAGKGCLDIKVESSTKSDGEYAEYEWSADLNYYENGAKLDSAKIAAKALLNSIDSKPNGLEIADSTPAQCFGPGLVYENDVMTSYRATVKEQKIIVTSKEVSNKRIFCPPHPEGLSSCTLSCINAKYIAVKDICEKSESKCDKAMAAYDRKNTPCESDCSAPAEAGD